MLVFDMPLTVGFCRETKIANSTFKWFFTRMSSHMSGQSAFVIAGVVAISNITNVGRSVHVFFIMSFVDRLNVSILLELAFQLLLKGSTLLYVRLELKSTNTPSIVASSCKQKSS